MPVIRFEANFKRRSNIIGRGSRKRTRKIERAQNAFSRDHSGGDENRRIPSVLVGPFVYRSRCNRVFPAMPNRNTRVFLHSAAGRRAQRARNISYASTSADALRRRLPRFDTLPYTTGVRNDSRRIRVRVRASTRFFFRSDLFSFPRNGYISVTRHIPLAGPN